MTERIEIYKKAIDKFGVVPQLLQTIEEMAELTQAISKIKRALPRHTDLTDAVQNESLHKALIKAVDELCDVELMIGQTKHILVDIMGYEKEYIAANENLDTKMKIKLDIK
jgi:hypothetical protein